MSTSGPSEDAVSEVVGEMLLIAIVLILVALVGIAIYHLLPAERDPCVTIKMNATASTMTLYHKGGDWVKRSELAVIIGSVRYPPSEFDLLTESGDPTETFDLGCRIHKDGLSLSEGDRVQLVTPRSILFQGVVGSHG